MVKKRSDALQFSKKNVPWQPCGRQGNLSMFEESVPVLLNECIDSSVGDFQTAALDRQIGLMAAQGSVLNSRHEHGHVGGLTGLEGHDRR